MDIFTWIITILAIVGVVLNINKRVEGFYLWVGSNLAWGVIDYNAGLYAQAVLFIVYTGLSVWGIIEWRKKDSEMANNG
jgi:nicotinamide riboside transporter PnuC